MGYTHYIDRLSQDPFSDENWAEYKRLVTRIIELATERNIGIERFDGELDEFIHFNGCVPPRTVEPVDIEDSGYDYDEMIAYGASPIDESDLFSHEDFYLARERSASREFCKTARKPYDTVVFACYLAAAGLSRGEISISTDGCLTDLIPGYRLYCSALGYVVSPLVVNAELDEPIVLDSSHYSQIVDNRRK